MTRPLPHPENPEAAANVAALVMPKEGSVKTLGFVIIDKETLAIDWDCELHPTIEQAIDALTGPFHMWCKSVDEESEDKTYWGSAYMICPVLASEPA